MKTEIRDMLERQACWQKLRKNESWGDKLRKSVRARESIGEFILGINKKRDALSVRGDLSALRGLETNVSRSDKKSGE